MDRFDILTTICNAFAHQLGRDLFIEGDAPSRRLLDFAHRSPGIGEHEYWGFGVHVVVSRI